MSTAVDLQLPAWGVPLLSAGPYRYRAFFGGRGGAKSWTLATALVVRAAQSPLRVLCCREVQSSIKASVRQLLVDRIEACGLASFYTVTDRDIRGANGSLFLFEGLLSNPDRIKSMEGVDIAWVAEANAISQASLDMLTPTIRKPGSELWFEWNPKLATDPVDAMFRGGTPPPGSYVQEVPGLSNPWFPDVLREEMEWCRDRDPDKYAHVWGGGYLRISEATVFRNWKVLDFESPPRADWRQGADFGHSVDPSVLVRAFIGRLEGAQAIADPDGPILFVDHEAWGLKVVLDALPGLFGQVPDAKHRTTRADSSRPETIQHLQSYGWAVQAAKKGAGSVEEGVAFLQSYDIVVHPRCQHVADEMALYSRKVDKKTGEVLPELLDKQNHCIDALRYACEGLPRNGRGRDVSFVAAGGRTLVDMHNGMPPGRWGPDESAPDGWVYDRRVSMWSEGFGPAGGMW